MANNTYYWDNGIRVHITRGKLQSSMAWIAKHTSRHEFDWHSIDQKADYVNTKQKEQTELDEALAKLRTLIEE